jgi:hypothetical protein
MIGTFLLLGWVLDPSSVSIHTLTHVPFSNLPFALHVLHRQRPHDAVLQQERHIPGSELAPWAYHTRQLQTGILLDDDRL